MKEPTRWVALFFPLPSPTKIEARRIIVDTSLSDEPREQKRRANDGSEERTTETRNGGGSKQRTTEARSE